MTMTRTTCPYCGVGCGVLAETAVDGVVSVRGDPEHPANRGRLCSKGTALAATLGTQNRLLHPEVDGRRVSWNEALAATAGRLQQCITEHGRDSVAFYVSGQLLTEDYYVANKLMKGYIGTANIDTNSRLCMSSAVAGHLRAFGEDVVPVDYEDVEAADLLVLVGSNLAWCHPVLMQRIQAQRESRPTQRVIVIDPRRTATAEQADLHLPVRSGADVMLFNGLLAWLADHGHAAKDFVAAHTSGLESALVAARLTSADITATAQACSLDAAQVQQFFEWFGTTRRVVTIFSQGVNQSSVGTDKVNAIINCHLLTGRIGSKGMGPFSITGQPNAMGGREVGGLATQLAAHLALEDPAHRKAVQEFWGSPRIADQPGLKAVDLFDAVAAGRIKAIWIIATNPVVSLPDADQVKRALRRCPLVIMSDCVAANDTLPYAHIRLPAAAWGEKGGTVTNSDRYISRQRAFLPLPGDARPDWWMLCEVAKRMGFGPAFEFADAADVFDEHARLTQCAMKLGKLFDLRGLAGLSATQYDALQPRQWPVAVHDVNTERPFSTGRFSTDDGRARFIATAARAPHFPPTSEYPMILNTGRMRDQWHTMTRTARAPALNAHEPEPYLDANRIDLDAAGVRVGEVAQVVTRWGTVMGRARASGDVPAGMVFMPIHFNAQFAHAARVGAAVNAVVDPVSGEPEFKHTPARIEALVSDWRGFLLSRSVVSTGPGIWWAASQGSAAHRLEFVGRGVARPDQQWLRDTLQVPANAEWIEYEDPAGGNYRAAVLVEGRLEACMMIAGGDTLPARSWLQSLFDAAHIDADDRRCLLLGARADRVDPGPMVCACFAVGANVLRDAVLAGGTSVEALGKRTRAGTNCGSCRPELSKIVATYCSKP